MVWHVVPQTRHRPGFQALASGTFSLHRSQRPLSLLRFRPEPVRGTLTVATLDPPIGSRHRTATLNGAQPSAAKHWAVGTGLPSSQTSLRSDDNWALHQPAVPSAHLPIYIAGHILGATVWGPGVSSRGVCFRLPSALGPRIDLLTGLPAQVRLSASYWGRHACQWWHDDYDAMPVSSRNVGKMQHSAA